MNESLNRPSKFRSWILASRPKTLLAAVVPVLIGTSVAVKNDSHNFAAATIALLCSILIQIGTNFVNDLYDFLSGKDTEERKGPTRALAAGWISKKEMKLGIYLTFGIAFLAGLYLVYIGGSFILIIGIVSILTGISYTAGPFPLAYNGLGDIFVFIFFGLVATCGTYYVQTLEINSIILLASIPAGLLITNILVINNFRDIDEDKLNNKNTLAVKFGRTFTKAQYISSIILSYIAVISIYYFSQSIYILLPLVSIPLAIKQILQLNRLKGTDLNFLLESTAKFSALFGILLSLGFLL
ncbi:MAG: 1,4-dihydroxy-2-naphthoate polyprenyltransferase [Melioribacteraceae bacterium]|nr:1,4-dihydroxy-2-naphthoate polyprenyltransferase [Melioribacteraceae bacterium]